MAIENNFLHFNTEDTFQNQKSEIKDASIAFIKDSGKIYTHGEEYESVNWGEIKYPNGVYVYTNKGELVNPEEWDTANNDSAVGVAVIDDNCQFIIDKSLPMVNSIAWSSTLYGTDIADLTNYTDASTAQTDYAGQSNTDIIIAQSASENSSNNAAHYCYEQTLNGQHGYLPAAGELYTLWENKTEVNNALTTIGAITIDTAFNNLYSSGYHYPWSSTEYSSNPAWYLYWEGSSSPLGYGGKGGTKTHNYAFPFFPLNI